MDVITHGNWRALLGFGLTDRETEISLLVTVGKSNKEIGRFYGISPETVKKSLRRAMDRLEVDRRSALVAEAIRRGIIAPLVLLLCVLSAQAEHQNYRPVRKTANAVRVAVRHENGALA
jgi:DNA-binding CsgD family transcriptional regulator